LGSRATILSRVLETSTRFVPLFSCFSCKLSDFKCILVYSGFTRNHSISNPHTPRPEKLRDLAVIFRLVDFGGEMSSNAGCPSGFSVDFPMQPAYQSEDTKPLKFYSFGLVFLANL
jgi:hypothetical protein